MTRSFLSLFFLSFSTAGWALPATPSIVAVVPDASCVRTGDSSEEGWRFSPTTTLNAGLCLDSREYRPARRLRFEGDLAIFDNYFHAGKFWNAKVPLTEGLLKAVYFHIERFSTIQGVTAAHTELRFVFNGDAVQLVRTGQALRHGDVLVSFEGGRPPDTEYNFALGTFNTYNLVPRVMSAEQKLALSGGETNFEQYELKLDPSARIELLKRALQRSADLGVTTYYNTLKPNCTTEVFDLLDSVPALANRAAPFLTVISPDPIATPSLNALRARGLLGTRVQDFNDEAKGVFKTLPVPEPAPLLAGIFPQVQGRPWTVSVVAPPDSDLNPVTREVIKTMFQEIYHIVPKFLQSFGSAMVLTDRRDLAREVLVKSLIAELNRLPELLRQLDSKLPDEPVRVHAYFLPLKPQAGDWRASLVPLGIQADLPFDVRVYRAGLTDTKSRETFFELGLGAQLAAQAGVENPSYGFISGLGITLHLQRGHSRVITQVLTGLEPADQALSMINPQVNIQRLVIPGSDRSLGRVLALVTHVQDVTSSLVNPEILLSFGPWGGIAGVLGEFGHGTFQVFEPEVSCSGRLSLSPLLRGTFEASATGVNGVDLALKGQPVQFHLLRAKTNLLERRVKEVEVRVSALGFQCLEIEQVKRQFGDEMTQMMRSSLNQLKPEQVLRRLTPFF